MTSKDIRIIVAWIFLIITFALVWAGGWWLGLFTFILVVFGTKELLHLLNSKDFYPSPVMSYLGSAIFVVLGCIGKMQYMHLAAIAVVVFSFLTILFRGKNGRIMDIGATLLTTMYCGLLPSHFVFMRNMDAGFTNIMGYDIDRAFCFVVLTVCCITVTDVCAYFAGCKYGKHKLCEAISPKKTVEGALAGALASMALSLLIGYDIGLNIWQSLGAGFLITVFAQLGDLVESMMKRDAGTKDASDVLPGHGGFLDRADSYVFTVAVIYYYYWFVIVNPVF